MEQGVLFSVALPLSLFIIMAGMGLTLTPRDFRNVFITPKATVFGIIGQIILLPLVALALALLLNLPPALAIGLIVIAACPGGTTSNLFVYLGRGDLALSIVLTVVASLITILTLPLITGWALAGFRDADEVIALPIGSTMVTLFAIILLPVMIGMSIRHFYTAFAAKAERFVSIFGFVVLVVIIAIVLVDLGDQAVSMFKQAGVAVILLNLAGVGLGLLGGRAIGLAPAQRFAVAVELGIKNGTLGLMVTLTLLQSEAMSVPAAAYSLVMFIVGFFMLALARRAGLRR